MMISPSSVTEVNRPDEEGLILSIVAGWHAMPIPSDAELVDLWHEYGDPFYSVFAGKAALEIDRGALNGGMALLFMSPKAALTYVGSYMIALLELLPKRKQGEFVFDHLLKAHLLGQLKELSFLEGLLDAGLSREQAHVIESFLKYCVKHSQDLDLDEAECHALEAARAWLSSNPPGSV